MLVTCPTSHLERSWLKALALLNIEDMVVTRDTSQASMAPCVEPASQFAPVPATQQFAPVQ